jgi:hypothetical protein
MVLDEVMIDILFTVGRWSRPASILSRDRSLSGANDAPKKAHGF